MNKDAELLQQLVKILSNHCGETGENEGAVQTLNRIIEYAEKWNKLDSMITGGLTELKNDHEIVEQLKKLLGNTTKNPEHCCQAFEYIRDTLQKIVREKNDKHTEIVLESEKKFKTHTKDQEVDI